MSMPMLRLAPRWWLVEMAEPGSTFMFMLTDGGWQERGLGRQLESSEEPSLADFNYLSNDIFPGS